MELGDVGVGGGDVARLHGLEHLDRFPTERLFQGLDHLHQADGTAVADVQDAVLAGRRRMLEGAHDPVHDVVDEGEVTRHAPLAKHLDRLARQDLPGEDEIGHVGPTPGAIDGEEPEAGLGQTIEPAVSAAHQLGGPLGGGVERGGDLGRLVLAEGAAGAALAIDRARGRVDQVLESLGVAASLQHRQMPGEIGPLVGEGVVDRVAHAGLRREMHHPPGAGGAHQGRKGLSLCDVHALQLEARAVQQRLDPRLLQGRVVIGIEVVHPQDLFAAIQQPLADEAADEPCGAGDDDQGRLFPRQGCPQPPVFPPSARKSNPARPRSRFRSWRLSRALITSVTI